MKTKKLTKVDLEFKINNQLQEIQNLRELLTTKVGIIETQESTINTLVENHKLTRRTLEKEIEEYKEKAATSIKAFQEEIRLIHAQNSVYYRALMLTQAVLQACPLVDIQITPRKS